MTFIQHHDHPTAAHKLPRCVFFSGPTKAPEVVRIPGDRALLPPQQPNDFAPTVRSPPHVADFLVAPGGEPQTAKMRIAQFFLHAIGVFLNLFFVCRKLLLTLKFESNLRITCFKYTSEQTSHLTVSLDLLPHCGTTKVSLNHWSVGLK